jgi:predicted lipid-binding transport protein (Tim44 family)
MLLVANSQLSPTLAVLRQNGTKKSSDEPIHALFICIGYLSEALYHECPLRRQDMEIREVEIRYVTVEIVILAMIAAFLGLRLYAVLGRRADHGDEPVQSRIDAPPAAGNSSANKQAAVPPAQVRLPDRSQAADVARPANVQTFLPAVERGLRDITGADRRFEIQAFLDGARSAYRMILEAFWRGDKDELAQLCDPHVAAGFIAEIDARTVAGETLVNRLVRIEEVEVASATYAAPIARITLRLAADIASVTRDAQGTVIAGSLDDAVEVHDVWTFSRNVGSPNPDWLLDETDEA